MIIGNVYGKNDAPAVWYQSFDQEARAAGFERSSFDKCLYYVRDEERKLYGVLVVHVDDNASGATSQLFNTSDVVILFENANNTRAKTTEHSMNKIL